MLCHAIHYTTDANGNPVARGTDSFSYDSQNRLEAATVNGQTASYGYNVLRQRVSKTVGSDTTLYFYGPGGELLAEVLASSGLTSAEYAWLNGEPMAHFRNGSTHFVHNDHLATPQRLTDSTGSVSWSADYEPFGKAQTTGIEFNLRFPGQYFDAETGLHYNWHRYYDPDTGRYITSDPIGLEGGINTYAYAYQNPIVYYDPNGKTPAHVIGTAAGFVFGAGSAYFNGGDFGTILQAGAQGAVAGFISGGGSVVTGVVASIAISASLDYLQCGSVSVGNAAANASFAVGGGLVGRFAGAFVPFRGVRQQRGLFGRFSERIGLLGPKIVDGNAALREGLEAGVGASVENAAAGAYSASSTGPCSCQ